LQSLYLYIFEQLQRNNTTLKITIHCSHHTCATSTGVYWTRKLVIK